MLIDQASKEQLAECARLLALNLARYQGLYGEEPSGGTLAILGASEPDDEQAKRLADSMENFVGVRDMFSAVWERKTIDTGCQQLASLRQSR